jgi:uncharacterized protein YndB with AHSA1/START domain
MNKTLRIAPVRKTVLVAADPQRAFEVFTAGLDRWWPKSHGIGSSAVRRSVIEPFEGGRWYSNCEDGSDVVIGHVRVWEPGARFVVSWEINAQWKSEPRAVYASEVEVRFTAEEAGRTRVEVEHRDFERMESGAESLRNDVDRGWPGLLERYAQQVAMNP